MERALAADLAGVFGAVGQKRTKSHPSAPSATALTSPPDEEKEKDEGISFGGACVCGGGRVQCEQRRVG